MADDFALSIKRFAELTTKEVMQVRENVQKEVVASIISDTPVDSGLARLNWIASKDSAATHSVTLATSGGNPTAEQQSKAFGEDGVFYFVNNLTYISVLEYGGYPSPVKRGSWNKDRKFYEVKSTGGYSYQAPQGMVRKNMQRIADNLKAKYG